MRQLVLATRNKGKIAEFERMLNAYSSDIQVLGLADFPDLPDVDETGATFIENSLLLVYLNCYCLFYFQEQNYIAKLSIKSINNFIKSI